MERARTGIKHNLAGPFSDFGETFRTFYLVLIASSVLLVLTTLYPQLYGLLSDSRSTPWGVVTSIFVHSSLFHFAGNTVLLFAFLLLFASLLQDLAKEEKHRLSVFFAWNVLFSGIIANILFMLFSSGSAAGASGVVYASEGVTMGFALLLAVPGKLTREALRDQFQSKESGRLAVKGLVTFSVLFIFLVFFPRDFLSAAPGVNVFVHFAGFYVSFVSVVGYQTTGRFQNVSRV